MTAAHTAVLQHLRALLQEMPDVAISVAHLPGRMAHVHYDTTTITIADHLGTPGFATALMYGVLSLRRGPYPPSDAETAEHAVMNEMVQILVPPSGLPPDSDPHTVADTYGVDISVARQAVALAQKG
jgi:hypothetical protein